MSDAFFAELTEGDDIPAMSPFDIWYEELCAYVLMCSNMVDMPLTKWRIWNFSSMD
ncbi:hypothetical protein AAHV55_14215 [Klebsiella pneumoniae]